MPPSPTISAALQWSSLQVLNRERYDALLNVFENLDTALKHLDEQLLRSLGCRESTVRNAMERLETCDPAEEEALLASQKARIIVYGDASYPRRLAEIPDAPIFLYVRGDLSVLDAPSIALVGTRRMTAYGKRVATEFARALVQARITTVSGLARGIDACVAEETIESGGKTVAVLGQGLSTLRGEPKSLMDQIVDAGGVMLSEFPLRSGPDLFTFPLRNRIIAGLSLGTVVLEAPEKSGALITARLAFDYGREVFAVPGHIFDENFSGCHALIAEQKAMVARSPVHVLRELGVIAPDPESSIVYSPQNSDEEAVLKALSSMPAQADELVEKSGLAPSQVNATLLMLELNGAARNLGGGQWVRG